MTARDQPAAEPPEIDVISPSLIVQTEVWAPAWNAYVVHDAELESIQSDSAARSFNTGLLWFCLSTILSTSIALGTVASPGWVKSILWGALFAALLGVVVATRSLITSKKRLNKTVAAIKASDRP